MGKSTPKTPAANKDAEKAKRAAEKEAEKKRKEAEKEAEKKRKEKEKKKQQAKEDNGGVTPDEYESEDEPVITSDENSQILMISLSPI